MIQASRRIALALLAGTGLATGAQAADITSIRVTGATSNLVTVDSAAPGTIRRTTAISGMTAGDTIVGFDARPASRRVFYGLANTGRLYAINALTGQASVVASGLTNATGGAAVPLTGTAFGVDFNPTVDRIRVVSNTGQNLRINPDNGSTTVDGPLRTAVGAATLTGTVGAAYANNVNNLGVAGATTTLYVINSLTDTLGVQTPPNDGVIAPATVRTLGVNTSDAVGFDIQTVNGTNTALATLTDPVTGVTSLYSINLAAAAGTNAATLIGTYGGTGNTGTYLGLAFAPTALAASATTANQLAVANTLDAFTGTAAVPVLTALDALPSNADRASALSQLGPNSYSILPEIVLQTNEFVDSTLRRYLRDARAGGTGSDDMAAQGSDRQVAGFLVGSGRDGKFKARGDRAEINYGSTGVIAGLDVRLAPTTLIGITGGYDSTDFRLNPVSQKSRAKTWFVGGYGTIGLGAFYVDLAGSYGETDYTLRRNVNFAGFTSAAVSDGDSKHYSISGTTGLSFDFVGFEAEACGGARYVNLDVDGFSEGAGATALTVGAQDIDSLQSIAGLRIGADYDIGGAKVRPSIRGEYRHEFENDDPRLLTASFNGAGVGTPFGYVTTPMGDDFGVFGAGLTISGASPISVVLDYTGQFFGGFEIHAAQAGARYSF